MPDVMAGVLELARLLVGENRAVAFATPAYRPFIADLPPSGLVVQEVPLLDDGAIDVVRLRAAFEGGTRVFLSEPAHLIDGSFRGPSWRISPTCASNAGSG